MSDLETLVVFVVLVGLVVAFGVLIGMIVAGRIDRLMAPRPVPGVEEPTEQEQKP